MKLAFLTPALRIAVTLLVVIAALIGARWMWIHYQVEPWTRDGRVRADVVAVSPDVSALVTEVDVNDNQPVKKGQRLFALDRPRFQVALEQAEAALKSQTTALAEARREDARNRKLGDLVPAETVEQGAARVAELQAAVAQAKASLDAAKLNLARTVVYAPLDGVVANATLHPGDYLAAGRPALGLVDSETLHVDGYFEETKLARIRIGDPVTVELVGDPHPLKGHVASISPGIEDRERGPSGDLLPNVNPTFSWVRLAQRIPVRIQLDALPPGAPLIAGRTATVTVHPVDKARRTQKVWPW
jgi:multidrug resistance efflux pump